MNNAPAQQTRSVHNIARSAQRKIKNITGMNVSVILYPTDQALKTPEQMLKIVALALDMKYECFRKKSRIREITELRFIGALLLRMNFPCVTLNDIARLFGGQDHSSIINGLARAHSLIYTGDLRFVKKYNTAVKSVDIWLKREEPGYATAGSA